MTENQIDEMRRKRVDGVLLRNLLKEYGLSKASVYRYLGGAGESES